MIWPNGSSFRRPAISSSFGPRKSPGGIGTTNHKGVDFPLPLGTRLVATSDGRVSYRGYLGGWGNHVKVEHRGYRATYSHMQSSTYVKMNQYLEEGQKVGNVGMTGNTTGPHVHFEILVDGEYIDPVPFITARLTPPTQQSGGGVIIKPNPGPSKPVPTPTPTPTLEEILMVPYPHVIAATQNSTHTEAGDVFVVTHDSVDHVTGPQLKMAKGRLDVTDENIIHLTRDDLNAYANMQAIPAAAFQQGAHWHR